MNVLVIGNGGREHSLVWKLNQSNQVKEIHCVPGNAGTKTLSKNWEIDPLDFSSLSQLAQREGIDITVVGPEAPLVAGLVDYFQSKGLKIFGPTEKAARIEGSKSFTKRLLKKYQIPTGHAEIFDDYNEGCTYIQKCSYPIVIKADGLAGGKGVTIAQNEKEAITALENCFLKKKFGEAGKTVLIEEYLSGPEVSVLAFTDGDTVLAMEPAQDYKRVNDGDKGPNTGGMGAYSPVPLVTEEIFRQIVETIMKPTVEALSSEGIRYQGVLYGGLVLTKEGPKVLEFNVRFGDPESQALLPRLDSELLDIILAVVEGRLCEMELRWLSQKCVTVVLASSGYPSSYKTGFKIEGLEEAANYPDVCIFQAGTAQKNESIVTAGGRVLNVTAMGEDFLQAREKVYHSISKIRFEGIHYRRDIGLKALNKNSILAGGSAKKGSKV